MSSPRLRTSTKIGYAFGSVGTGGFSTVPGLLLLYYLTDELGVTALVAGIDRGHWDARMDVLSVRESLNALGLA